MAACRSQAERTRSAKAVDDAAAAAFQLQALQSEMNEALAAVAAAEAAATSQAEAHSNDEEAALSLMQVWWGRGNDTGEAGALHL